MGGEEACVTPQQKETPRQLEDRCTWKQLHSSDDQHDDLHATKKRALPHTENDVA